ncbi:MAG: DMT family transporter [Bosea sp. (in: a-proteobacteria)]
MRGEASRGFVLGHLLACALFWGSSFLFIKLVSGDVSPWVIAACRGLIGAATLMLWVAWLGQVPLPRRDEIKHWLILGTSNGWLPNVLVAFALTRLDSGPAAMIQATGPLVTAIIAHMAFADERLTPQRFAGIVLGFIGVGLIIGPDALKGSGTLAGILAMLGVTLGYAVGNLYTRTIRNADATRLALGQQFVSGLVATVLALVLVGAGGFAPVPGHALPLLALGILATALPMAIFMRLITHAGPTRAALTGYLVPTVAVILGIVVLGERLSLMQGAGAITVLAGLALASGARKRQESAS